MRTSYVPVDLDPFTPHVTVAKNGRWKRILISAAAACAALMLLAALTYSSAGQKPLRGGLAEKATAGAPTTQLQTAAPGAAPAAAPAGGEAGVNVFDAPYSTPGTGIFTGHRHGMKGGRLTFGQGTYHNIFDPNPDSDLCPAGHFTNAERSCVECPMGKWCPGTNVVNECPAGSTSPPGANALEGCICNAGTFGPPKACVTCPAGSYCPGNTQGPGGKTIPQACPAKSMSDEGQAVCRCKPGFWGEDFAACETCPANSYCPGGRSPVACPANTVSQPGAALCSAAPGFYGPDGEVPTQCASNMYCPGATVVNACPEGATSSRGSTSLEACTCAAGWNGPAGGPCERCPAGFYCSGGTAKGQCAADATAPEGSTRADQCACKPGYTGVPTSCRACPVGQYCSGGSAMARCPGQSTSYEKSSKLENCYCQVGYIGADPNTCRRCPVGQYCLGGDAINDCPDHMSSATGSWKVEQCRCIGGFFQSAGGAPCNTCPADNYCPGGDNSFSKISCPANSQAFAGSSVIDACSCRPGYYSTGANQCGQCPAGYYCTGNAPRRQCPNGASAPAGSDEAGDCRCNAGYFATGSGSSLTCTTCPANFYCSGDGAKISCPAPKISGSGITSEAQCYVPSVQQMRQYGMAVPDCPARDHDDSDSVILYQNCGQGVNPGAGESIIFGNYEYATIDMSNPRSNDIGCQTNYYALPPGWELAPDDSLSQTAAYSAPWGTHVVVMASGRAYGTSTYSQGAFNGGAQYYLSVMNNQYKPGLCSARVFMRQLKQECRGNDQVYRSNGYDFRTLDNVCFSDSFAHCQRDYLALPGGWEIAPNDGTTRQVISGNNWGTHVVVTADGTSYHTQLYPPAGNVWNYNMLGRIGNTYKPNSCSLRILLRRSSGQREGMPAVLSTAFSQLTSWIGMGEKQAEIFPSSEELLQSPVVHSTSTWATVQKPEPSLMVVNGTSASEKQPDLTSATALKIKALNIPARTQSLALQGWYTQLQRGDYATLGSTCDNDRAMCIQQRCNAMPGDLSAMDIPEGMSVTLYDQTSFRGRSITLTGPMVGKDNCLDQDKFQAKYWNDRVQSLKINGGHSSA